MTRIAFSWNGLPQYAARLIGKAAQRLGEDCAVIGSRPDVPVEGMEKVLQAGFLGGRRHADQMERSRAAQFPKFSCSPAGAIQRSMRWEAKSGLVGAG